MRFPNWAIYSFLSHLCSIQSMNSFANFTEFRIALIQTKLVIKSLYPEKPLPSLKSCSSMSSQKSYICNGYGQKIPWRNVSDTFAQWKRMVCEGWYTGDTVDAKRPCSCRCSPTADLRLQEVQMHKWFLYVQIAWPLNAPPYAAVTIAKILTYCQTRTRLETNQTMTLKVMMKMTQNELFC